MRFLSRFFLRGYDMVDSCSSYKGIHRIHFHLSIFNLPVQLCKLSLIFSLCFYYIQIICCYKHIEQMANRLNLFLSIFRRTTGNI